MRKRSAHNSSYVKKLLKYKDSLHWRSIPFSEVDDFLNDKKQSKFIVSHKIDGELHLLVCKDGTCELFSRGGIRKWDLPVLKELERKLGNGHYEIVVELYYGKSSSPNGLAIPYPDAQSQLKAPSQSDEKRMYLWLIDILKAPDELDTSHKVDAYKARLDYLKKKVGKGRYYSVIDYVEGSSKSVLERYWSGVESNKYEGIVVWTDKYVIKSKKLFDQDVVVIFVEESKKQPGLMGALGLAYYSDGKFYYAGKVGTGFDDDDRRKWLSWAKNHQVEGPSKERVIWVKPEKIVAVTSAQLMIRKRDVYKYSRGKYEKAGKEWAVSFRQPRFVKERNDKSVSAKEVGFGQVPDFQEKVKQKKIHQALLSWLFSDLHFGYAPHHPDKAVIKSKYYNSVLKEKHVYYYYEKNKKRVYEELKGHTVLLFLAPDNLGSKPIVKRNHKGERIKIKNEEDYDFWNNGRVLEFHIVYDNKTTDHGFIDIDPHGDWDWNVISELASDVVSAIKKFDGVSSIKVNYSGGRGYHIHFKLKRKQNIDDLRKNIEEYLTDWLQNHERWSKDVSVKLRRNARYIRLDVSTMHYLGSLRATWSLDARTGLICMPVPIDKIKTFKPEQARIDKLFPSFFDEVENKDLRREVRTAKSDLNKYKEMRCDESTEPPWGKVKAPKKRPKPLYVIQRHNASHLHWDLRLEHDGVLVSWAIPKHRLPKKGEKLLAVQTENHPIDYAYFEGKIPEGCYGAGTVKVVHRGKLNILKWKRDEVLFEIESDEIDSLSGKFGLIRKDGKNWFFIRLRPDYEP